MKPPTTMFFGFLFILIIKIKNFKKKNIFFLLFNNKIYLVNRLTKVFFIILKLLTFSVSRFTKLLWGRDF